jgi:hypothetical protein
VTQARVGLALAALLLAPAASAFPVDAHEETQIHRLLAFDLAREGLLRSGGIVPGSLWSKQEVRLRLAGLPFTMPRAAPAANAELRALLGRDAGAYGVAVLDLSDPAEPVYAEHNAGYAQIPGSVGKILVALAWFQALADVYPGDVEARNRVLRDTLVTADSWIRTDEHVVPFWRPYDPKVTRRPIEEGDQANLWTWLDWMISASSNAAASTVLQQLIVFKHFGRAYPVPEAQARAFLASASPGRLSSIFVPAVLGPIRRSGLDPRFLAQGSFFTRGAKARVAGAGSTATARELLHYLVRMEQGKLVDPWSSLQIKRLLYLSDVRIRFASQPALDDAAVYFKSGSLYACRPEPRFACSKYHGNVKNYMNSVAVVEAEEQGRSLHYVAVVLSNVLRKDSTEVHRDLALRLHQQVERRHGITPRAVVQPATPPPNEQRSEPEVEDPGR